jgi:hypothetical protein
MTTGYDVGRLDSAALDESSVTFDAPNMAFKAVLTKQDMIIDKLNTILAAIEAATDGNSLFTALDVAATKAAINKIKFTY